MDSINLIKEKKSIEFNAKTKIKELNSLSQFFKLYMKNNLVQQLEQKEEKQKQGKVSNPQANTSFSILSTNIQNIYDSFDLLTKTINNLMNSMNDDLVKPLDEFIQNQKKSYRINIDNINNLSKKYEYNKNILERKKNSYYKSSYICTKIDSQPQSSFYIKGEDAQDIKRDNAIHKKMTSKNDEKIYKYEISKFNKNIILMNKEYEELIDNIKNCENSRIFFIKSTLDKYKKYLLSQVSMVNSFVQQVNKFFTNDIFEKDINYHSQEASKFIEEMNKNKEKNEEANKYRIPQEDFVSYQKYYELNKEKINKGHLLLNEKVLEESSYFAEMEDKDQTSFIKSLVDTLISENEVPSDNLALAIELIGNPKYDTGKKLLNNLYEKRGVSSIKFSNMQNLEHLGNILNYISLHENSIFSGKFELNFKIIFIAERIFYQKKNNNDKVYLSAILSKNKYYRTKEFWRNVLELKLANKLADHIKRLKNSKIIDEKSKGGFFNKIGTAMGLNNNLYKNSLISKSRIFPLIKDDYNLIDSNKIEIVDRITSQEMQSLIRENIPSFANFNFPSEQCLDLIAQLTQDYKVEKENIKFYVTYFNVSNSTIRKTIPNTGTSIKESQYSKYSAQKTELHKKIKLFDFIIPFLSYEDYNKLVLCNRIFNKKIAKKIYKYVLAQKNLSMKARLAIWKNLLGISEIKKKYNYQEILANSDDDKCKNEIRLDVVRTTVGNVENPEEVREKITNVLYAVAQLNGSIKYCQGMNFIVQFLFEIYGEEDTFYVFLAFFIKTEYSLIFAKDLEKLKIFFYVFKRVISLLEPELSSYFNSNGIDVNFFMPPWFITLFTGSHQYCKGENDNTQILIRILDNFIVHGWKSTMEVGCVALHYYEDVLLSKRYEDLMQFLINDLLRSDFFSKKNQGYIENFFTETKISKKLIKNIEEEYYQEQKLNNKK